MEIDVDSSTKRETRADIICPVELSLDVIGGKWRGATLYHLMDGTKRFGELRRTMPRVTQRMLTLQLRELEADGLVHRQVYAEVPPRVEYSLTDFGRTLEEVIMMIGKWGNQHRTQLVEAERDRLAS